MSGLILNTWMISSEEYLEILKMKKDQKPTSDLRDLLRIKEPSDRGGKKPILKKTHFTIWYFVDRLSHRPAHPELYHVKKG